MSAVEDTLAISRLIYRFGYLLDKADFEGIADLFAHGSFGSAELGRFIQSEIAHWAKLTKLAGIQPE